MVLIESGSLNRLLEKIPRAHAYVVIADRNVARLYGEQQLTALRRGAQRAELLTFDAGESNKTRETWAQLSDRMLAAGYGRDSCVVALGGGVTCDMAGFVAATFMRGVPLVHVPTTLLAMIDAAIGGKTGIDTPHGKNLIGAFHEPALVIIDPLVLGTLPDTELSGGLAEAIKHGAIADAAYLRWIEHNASAIFARESSALDHLIARSVAIKQQFVNGDLREAGQRAALNFGHTIGHAIEQVTNYAVAHGAAVAIGMLIESEIGVALGVTAPETTNRIRQALEAAHVPHVIGFEDVSPLIEATRSDKKARAGAVRYTLLQEPGRLARTGEGDWTFAVPDDVVREALKQF